MRRQRQRQRQRRAIAVALFACAAAAVPAPAAGATLSGPLSLHGAVVLDEFPCLPAAGCTGTFIGQVRGTVAGTDVNGVHFEAVFPDPSGTALPNNLQASYGYAETCVTGLLPPTGTASGTFQLSDGLLIEGTTMLHGATVSGGFGWLRAGAAVVITLSGTTLWSPTGSMVAGGALEGAGAGAFLPTNGPGTCQSPEFGQQALVAGVVLQPT